MSGAEVRREGLEGVRPGRQSRTWSGSGDRLRVGPPHDHPGSSYYGRPVINPPVWAESDIASYLFTGGLAGACSLIAAGADATDRPQLARRTKVAASGAIAVSLAALIHDLGRPARFLNMLRVFKPTSPMSVGVWLLAGYAPLAAGAAASDVLGMAPRSGRIAGAGAAVLGAGVATYTAALISDTAVPAWHEGHREMPFVFAGSAAAAAAGLGLVVAPLAENAPTRRLAALGAAAELVAEQLMERRLGSVAQALHEGTAGRRLNGAKAATALGAALAAGRAQRSRTGAMVAGVALLAGSALTRFGLFAGGIASARDPKHTVDPQRRRLA